MLECVVYVLHNLRVCWFIDNQNLQEGSAKTIGDFEGV